MPHLAQRDFNLAEEGGFRLHQSGYLDDMELWHHPGLHSSFWRFYHHRQAGSSIRTGRRVIPLFPRELVLIPENTSFDARGAAGVAHFWIHFSPPLGAPLPGRIFRLPVESPLESLLALWRDLLLRQPPEGQADPAFDRRLFHTCQSLLHAAFARLPLSVRETVPVPPALLVIMETIERSLGSPLSNAALARQAGRSIGGFLHWFKKGTGMTPARYAAQRRIREACRLLTLTDRSIEEIAEVVGFTNRHHFTRVFLRHAKQPPALFRRTQRIA